MATLPNLLQVMPSTLSLMELTGLWGSPKLIHRFVLMYCYGLLVMLLPRFVFGVGSEDVSAIIKSLAEVIFIVSIFVPTLIFAAKLRGLERVVRGLGEIFREGETMGYDLFSILIVVLSSLVEAFGYAYLGSELSEQAEEVGVACYDLPWYVNCSKELKGAFQLMIQRSQKVCQLTGIKMLPIELKTYGDVR
ncbi:hypothetical protein quinque_004849 [Culex quinquefasciatus]